MAKTRVHELAKEFGVESAFVLERLKEMGEFVKSASSTVSLPAELRFRREFTEQTSAGPARHQAHSESTNPFARGSRPRQQPHPLRVERRTPEELEELRERVRRKRQRKTSWDESTFDADGERIWRERGLGDTDAPLAMYLLENGIWPDDLQLQLRGRSAVSRLRGGEESWRVLVNEIMEVRSATPVERRELPSTAVTKRYRRD